VSVYWANLIISGTSSLSVIRYFQPKMHFFDRTFFFFGYILTVNTSSHVPVLNFETLKSLSLILGFSLDLSLVTIKFWLLNTLSQQQVWSGKVSAYWANFFFHLSLVKTIVKSAKYPVDNMPSLWRTITLFHKDEVPEIIKLAQYTLTLPLHTCSCERVFSN
jgi:hypothetical protein